MKANERAGRRLLSLATTLTLSAVAGLGIGIGGDPPAFVDEVWVTDQSDTAKESGGYLYIYDGAQLAANPA